MEQSRETYINAVGREIPKQIGNYVVKPYTGAYTTVPPMRRYTHSAPQESTSPETARWRRI